ncbi:MAG: hypothetical protein ED557_08385 [Balneola sp.]|nr:MAG: hypothetical protein ED557_08385 [Balneola sp.]
MKKLSFVFSTLFLAVLLATTNTYAQYGEPQIRDTEPPRNLYDEGYKTGFGFSLNLNDFGFGAGGQFRKGLGPYTEGLVNLKIAGLRDPSEQLYVDVIFGNRTIPSKYRRVTTFPLTVGIKRRVFPNQITDNFRVHTSINFGPVLTLTSPYFEDYNNNGYRDINVNQDGICEPRCEPVRDIFQSFSDIETELGWNGEILLGIDFGDNFAKLQSFQFGYNFYYYGNGIQILEPFQPLRDGNGDLVPAENIADGWELEPANDAVKFLGSAQITFVFGWMW